jgi:hypothetical protein
VRLAVEMAVLILALVETLLLTQVLAVEVVEADQ